ncbi:MAG: hypothetical protein JNM70_21695 [Anaerolineae bacterium]|nr:hypothetical protein [Anaerolineae bacterium]
MLRRNWNWAHFALIVVVVLLSLSVVTAQDQPKPEAVGLRPDAPPYALHGPYWVGVRDYSVPEGDTHFWVSVWYPALNPKGEAETITYVVSDERRLALSLPEDMKTPIFGHALAKAEPDMQSGPYPLVVYSPGLNMWRQEASYLMEHLASQGFVVMAMEHNGETLESMWGGAYYRPAETLLAIQYADQLTSADGDLAGLIDVDRLALMGISSGGWTALVGAGARMDLSGCPIFESQAPGASWTGDCQAFVPQQKEIASLFGMEAVPAALWPAYNDPRVDALIAMAPDGDIWGADYQGVASVLVPTLVIASSADSANVPEFSSYPIYEHLGSSSKARVVFANADHPIARDQCSATPWLVDIGIFWLCSDPVWDKNRAQDLVNHFTTAFLLDVLKGDKEAHAALAPDAVSFPGITYTAEGF